MDRTEILNRLLTGAAYIEREDIAPAKRAQARIRYDELEAEIREMDELEKNYKPPEPESVTAAKDKIREILQKKGAY